MVMAMSETYVRPVPTIGDTTSAQARQSRPDGWAMDAPTRDAIYTVMDARRDIRRYRPDPIPEEIIMRVLRAGHHGPSVGHSQPWRFIMITDDAIREQACVMADRCRIRQASFLDEIAKRNLLDLQLEGIREAPVGIVVACDRRAPHQGILGRATFPDADMWSCASAIENMWLAARAEGLGMGWVTLFEPDELNSLLTIPDGVETLGWLCLGWPDERPPSPGLERRGWSKRLPLEDVIIHNRWPDTAMAPPIHRLSAQAAQELDQLTKTPDEGEANLSGHQPRPHTPEATAVAQAGQADQAEQTGTVTQVGTAGHPGILGRIQVAPAARRVPDGLLAQLGIDHIPMPSRDHVVEARDRSDRLLTPPGSLGLVDQIVDRALSVDPQGCATATLVLAGADHPVTGHGISAFDPHVTADVMTASVQGTALGTALAATNGFATRVVDVGVATAIDGAITHRPLDGQGDLVNADGLSRADTLRLIGAGITEGQNLPQGLVCLGEVGVGNTTVASALAAVFLGLAPTVCVGLGAGSDTAMTERKRQVVQALLDRIQPRLDDPTTDVIDLLAAAGGPEFAFLTGVILGAADTHKVIIVDGLATTMSAIIAQRLAPAVQSYMVAGHQSREQAHGIALRELGLEPIGDWRLRAGEGAGAVMTAGLLHTVAKAKTVTATTFDPALAG